MDLLGYNHDCALPRIVRLLSDATNATFLFRCCFSAVRELYILLSVHSAIERGAQAPTRRARLRTPTDGYAWGRYEFARRHAPPLVAHATRPPASPRAGSRAPPPGAPPSRLAAICGKGVTFMTLDDPQ